MSYDTLGRWTALCATLLVAACQPDYVHVYAEGSSVELSSAPVTVQVDLFGADKAARHQFSTRFKLPTDGEASSQYADFNVVLDDGAPSAVDLRVTVTDTPTLWSSNLLLRTPGDERTLHLLLLAAESQIAPARVGDGEARTMALFSTGMVLAWLDATGVSLRIERVADALTGRADLIAADPTASKVRVASRPGAPVDVGPDLFALTWIGGDGRLRLLTQKENDRGDVLDLGDADDVLSVVGYGQAPYAVATIVRNGGAVHANLHDEAGAVTSQFDIATNQPVRRIRAVRPAPDGSLTLALETTEGWRLMRIDAAGSAKETVAVDGEIAAIAPSADDALLHLAVVVGGTGTLELRSFYAANLAPFATTAATIAAPGTLPNAPFTRVSLSSCAIVWPQLRDGGGGAFDLWIRDLDTEGMPVGEPRLLNGVVAGVHFAPTVECITSTRAYASFMNATDATSQMGNIVVRKLPPAPIQ